MLQGADCERRRLFQRSRHPSVSADSLRVSMPQVGKDSAVGNSQVRESSTCMA
jgi:hypothetical protein